MQSSLTVKRDEISNWDTLEVTGAPKKKIQQRNQKDSKNYAFTFVGGLKSDSSTEINHINKEKHATCSKNLLKCCF